MSAIDDAIRVFSSRRINLLHDRLDPPETAVHRPGEARSTGDPGGEILRLNMVLS